MTPAQLEKAMGLLTPQLTYDGFKELDMVIEAVIEDVPLKQKIFVDLEQQCSPNCILASVSNHVQQRNLQNLEYVYH
jgi:enoyl-CoA hydratase/3-hydroxyacyl-CoA dehydrogenase